jgi:hypothetical protein
LAASPDKARSESDRAPNPAARRLVQGGITAAMKSQSHARIPNRSHNPAASHRHI